MTFFFTAATEVEAVDIILVEDDITIIAVEETMVVAVDGSSLEVVEEGLLEWVAIHQLAGVEATEEIMGII